MFKGEREREKEEENQLNATQFQKSFEFYQF